MISMVRITHKTIMIGYIAVFLAGCSMLSCRRAEALEEKELVIALIPEKDALEQRRRYSHITSYLSRELDMTVRTEVLYDYARIWDVFLHGKTDAAFFGSFSYILTKARTGVEVIARPVWPDGSSTYTGLMFVRKDSGIKTTGDMKNRTLALVHKVTTAGYIFPLSYFKEHGIADMEDHFSEIYFAGSHDAAAWAVYTKEAEVGCCKNHIYYALEKQFPEFKEEMVVLAESPAVPSNGLAVRKDMEPALKNKLKKILIGLDKTKKGRKVLERFGAVRFIETGDEDYAPLYRMVEDLGIDLTGYADSLD